MRGWIAWWFAVCGLAGLGCYIVGAPGGIAACALLLALGVTLQITGDAA